MDKDIEKLDKIKKELDELLKTVGYGYGWEELADASSYLDKAKNKLRERE